VNHAERRQEEKDMEHGEPPRPVPRRNIRLLPGATDLAQQRTPPPGPAPLEDDADELSLGAPDTTDFDTDDTDLDVSLRPGTCDTDDLDDEPVVDWIRDLDHEQQ
jgi:hypothetical protein